MNHPINTMSRKPMPEPTGEYAICVATFYEDLAASLANSATEAFVEAGIGPTSVHVFEVPGAFELPYAAKLCAESGRFDGVACLGVVIRGETPHFDYICSQASRGIAAVAERHRIPVGFGLLTCDTSEQAAERAGGKAGNKGWEAALAALDIGKL